MIFRSAKFFNFLALIILLQFFFSNDSFAQTALGYREKVDQIKIKGLEYIEKGIIFSKLKTAIGEVISPRTISEDIKRIYDLGYFTDVQVEIDRSITNRSTVIFVLKEKPRIKVIEFKGNTILTDKSIREKTTLFENNMLNEAAIKEDVEVIAAEYRKKGYYKTRVSYKISPITEKFYKLQYIVDEFPQVYLTKINITGTKYFYPIDIKRSIQSAEVDCFAWMTETGVYDEEKINTDLQLVTQRYLQNGFIRMKIDQPKVQIITNPDYSRVEVDLHIKEGDQYFVGKVDVTSDDEWPLVVPKDEMLEDLILQPEDVFNPFNQQSDRFRINDKYSARGYAFAKVNVENKINDETKRVDIIYHIRRGEKAYIGRVEVSGNYETKDYVIRREMEIHDNELYNGVKLRRSQTLISRLGFFSREIRLERSEESEEDLDYDIHLEEIQTGTFTASLSYSEQAGTSVILNVSKRNFRGTGQTVAVQGQWSSRNSQQYDITFTEPYLFDTEVFSTLNVFYSFFDKTSSNREADTTTTGFNYRLGYRFWEEWSTSARYSFRNVEFSDADEDTSILTQNLNQASFRSVRLGLSYNSVDHPQFPTEGTQSGLFGEKVGDYFGGDQEFNRYDLNYQFFHSLNEDRTVIFMTRYRHSFLEQSNPDVLIPVSQRFRVGGITTVRGFDFAEIEGPQSPAERDEEKFDAIFDEDDPNFDEDTRDYLINHRRGYTQRILNLELLFPLTREGRNIRGVIFYDAGNVWAEDRVYELVGARRDDWYYRQSYGAGVRLLTPLGVLRFEYGTKLDRREGETTGKFDFFISGLF